MNDADKGVRHVSVTCPPGVRLFVQPHGRLTMGVRRAYSASRADANGSFTTGGTENTETLSSVFSVPLW